jgi:hypothetical protein
MAKRQPCADGCPDCPHGTYLYHVREEKLLDGDTNHHRTFLGEVQAGLHQQKRADIPGDDLQIGRNPAVAPPGHVSRGPRCGQRGLSRRRGRTPAFGAPPRRDSHPVPSQGRRVRRPRGVETQSEPFELFDGDKAGVSGVSAVVDCVSPNPATRSDRSDTREVVVGTQHSAACRVGSRTVAVYLFCD